jgi:hypothetical protein
MGQPEQAGKAAKSEAERSRSRSTYGNTAKSLDKRSGPNIINLPTGETLHLALGTSRKTNSPWGTYISEIVAISRGGQILETHPANQTRC